jgi:hypothetical protein
MNNKSIWPVLAGSLLVSACVQGDDDGWRAWAGAKSGRDVAPADNPLYQQECAACHFAYQPGLLPARSWQRVMAGLEDHFGDNAELAAADAAAIAAWLQANAADGSDYPRSRSIAASIPAAEAPQRVTATRYFARKHDELPARLVSGNPQVGSFSACQACHRNADQGRFNEHEVRIAGYGRWED